LFFSFIISYSFYYYNQQKEFDYNQNIAEKITDREDAVAEYIFADLRKNIVNDSKLIQLVYSNPVNYQEIEKRIRQVYLGGYWERYKVNFSVFDSLCRALIPLNNQLLENNSYFDEQINKDGLTTASEDLFFINKSGEEIKYIGKLELPADKKQHEKTALLYFEFIPRSENLKVGFPELLLDQTDFSINKFDKISYAIYKNNELIRVNGDLDYPRKSFWKKDNKNYFTYNSNNYKHYVFLKNNEISAVISKEDNNILSLFTSNSYFFFVFSLVVWFIFLIKEWKVFSAEKKSGSIQLRIQLLIVTIILFCITGLGIATFFFVEKQFKEKNIISLFDKLDVTENSLREELSSILSFTPAYKDYAGWLLKKHAELNATDISLYDSKGNLFSSSQPRLFNEGIISKKINPEAYKLLSKDTTNHVLIKDNIGNMNFYAAFRPIYTNKGTLIGYINLPYFAKQTDLEKDWNLYILAIINIYVVLFSLSTVASLIISNIVTKPLQIIQDSLSNIKIGQHNAPIVWNGDDELGKLVSEYNNMIKQLEENIIQLAKSEREGAWKEMAKQVAHEIKNPLTPMKLSIQHLERSLDVPPAELKTRIKHLSNMLIEQIDILANIATEFSSFAKMPQPKLDFYSVNDLIQNSVQLFASSEEQTIKLVNTGNEQLKARIDKDQFCRVINNLIKNAQQSIPANRLPKIIISLFNKEDKWIQIDIKDNGLGIPDELKSKIFYPNFSSKSDGMGLGLAMAKNIIESFNGTINFVTVVNEGTTFTILLPIEK
jgi:signal transduction histidine kinase